MLSSPITRSPQFQMLLCQLPLLKRTSTLPTRLLQVSGTPPRSGPHRSFAAFTPSTQRRAAAQKDNIQNKDSLNPQSNEYSKSGTDVSSAQQDEAAYDPSSTDPHDEKVKAGQGLDQGENPLEVSPANHDVSKPREIAERGPEGSPKGGIKEREREREKASGRSGKRGNGGV
ncbi:MAG: hypothetical protein M1825_001947 [Sarcosagium campestre]|nr:MAG: hypothetical protein M1825_001947 [Sarcosagium campestre]